MKKIVVFIVSVFVILFSMSSCDKAASVKIPTGQWTLATTYMDSKRADVRAVVASNFTNISKKETIFTFYENGVFIEKSKIGVLQSGSIALNGAQNITLDYGNVFTKGKLIQIDIDQFELQLDNGQTMVFEKFTPLADQK